MHRGAERDHIKQLLTVRNSLKKALVYGRQTYQPDTGDDDVAAYFYEGTDERVLAVVNTSTTRIYAGRLALRPNEASKLWHDALDPHALISHPARSDGMGRLTVTVRPADLRIYSME